MENIYCDPAPDEDEVDEEIYKVPRPITESEQTAAVTRRDSKGVVRRDSGDLVYRRTSSSGSKRLSNHSLRSQRSSSKSVSPLPLDEDSSEAIYANDAEIFQDQPTLPPVKKPSVAPKPPTKPKPPKIEAIECADELYESMEPAVLILSNVKDSSKQAIPVRALPSEPVAKRDPPQSKIPPALPDYEELDELDPPTKPTELIPALDDYVDMSGTDPIEDLQRSDEASKPHPPSKAPGKYSHTLLSILNFFFGVQTFPVLIC